MKATNKLRFVERTQPDYPGANTGRVVRILQQWWEASSMGEVDLWFGSFPVGETKGEWRDVPVEKEA